MYKGRCEELCKDFEKLKAEVAHSTGEATARYQKIQRQLQEQDRVKQELKDTSQKLLRCETQLKDAEGKMRALETENVLLQQQMLSKAGQSNEEANRIQQRLVDALTSLEAKHKQLLSQKEKSKYPGQSSA